MSNRLVIPVEFSRNKIEELELYAKLKEYSAPGAIIKDILKKKLSLDILYDKEDVEYDK